MKWNESGFRPPLCTYRLNWARRTSWGWWDDWDETALQIQDSKFVPWRFEAENATSRSRWLPTILTFTRGWGRNIFCFFQTAETGNRTPNSGVRGSGANHYPRAPALDMFNNRRQYIKDVQNMVTYLCFQIMIIIVEPGQLIGSHLVDSWAWRYRVQITLQWPLFLRCTQKGACNTRENNDNRTIIID